jgi:regulator of ribosome biosynthesis
MDVDDIIIPKALKVDREVTFHSNYLVAFDPNPVSDLQEDTRQTCQYMINSLFKNIVKDETGIYSQLDKKRILPRFKQIRPKALTKWEKFAKEKGIQKRKKQRVQYNEQYDDYRPTYGYKNFGKEKDLGDWLKVVGDDEEDPYEKEKQSKKKRIEKNEKQKEKNQRLLQVQQSTASVGKFFDGNKVLKKEKNYDYDQKAVGKNVVENLGKGVNTRKAIKSLK